MTELGKASRLKMLGRDLEARIKHSLVGNVVNKGRLTAQSLKAYRKMKPLMDHVDNDKCPYCVPLFQKIKDCQYIKDLPNGSFKEANEHIPICKSCSENLKRIMECPKYYGKKQQK